MQDLIGNNEQLKQLDVNELADDNFGAITIKDIISELEKPGRDPRPEFKTASFKEGINTINDLKVGMILEGVISNVANFGAFVDLGVHQDGLVHISSLTNKFVSDPREVVKAGDIVKVKVTEVDPQRKRISLTMRLDEAIVNKAPHKPQQQAQAKSAQPHSANGHKKAQQRSSKSNKPKDAGNAAMGNAFADAFAKLKK